jgi:hypothetical protein
MVLAASRSPTSHESPNLGTVEIEGESLRKRKCTSSSGDPAAMIAVLVPPMSREYPDRPRGWHRRRHGREWPAVTSGTRLNPVR